MIRPLLCLPWDHYIGKLHQIYCVPFSVSLEAICPKRCQLLLTATWACVCVVGPVQVSHCPSIVCSLRCVMGKTESVCNGESLSQGSVGRPIIGLLVFLGLSPPNRSSAWRKAAPAAVVASGYLPSSPLPPLTEPFCGAMVGSKISI